MKKPIKWPNWTNQYEDLKENNKAIRRITVADRAWDRANRIVLSCISAGRNLVAEFRKVKHEQS